MVSWRHVATAALVVGFATGSTVHAAGSGTPQPSAAGIPTTGQQLEDRPVTARVAPRAAVLSPPTTTVLDAGWNTGFYSASLVDHHGTIRVAYYADGSGTVELASCADPCLDPTTTVLADKPGIGTDIARIGDQLLVSYLDLDTRTVQLATCSLPGCDDVQIRPVASVNTLGSTHLAPTPGEHLVVGYPTPGGGLTVAWCHRDDCRDRTEHELAGSSQHSNLAAGGDGTVWAAHRAPSGHLTVSHCTIASCAPIATSDETAAFPSVAADADGTVHVSYHAAETNSLRLISCSEGTACREVVVDDSGDVGYFSDVTTRPEGFPLVAHRSESSTGLVVADCHTVDCTVVSHNVVDQRGAPGEHLSLAVGPDGHPRIAHHDASSRTLRLTTCGDPTCAAPPGGQHVGLSLSLASAPDGTPLVAWRHPATMDLRLSRCLGGPCGEGTPLDSGGDVGLHPTLFVGADTRVVHQDARDGALRIVTCRDGCGDPVVSTLVHPGSVAALDAMVTDDRTTLTVATRDGAIQHGRCTDRDCEQVVWSTIGQGRPATPVASGTAGANGATATAYADDAGALLAWCDQRCVTHRLTDAAVTAVDVAAVGGAVAVVTRDRDGHVEVFRCDADGCSSGNALAGRHDHVSVDGAEGRLTVATVDSSGTVRVSDCEGGCATVAATAAFESPTPVWHLDIERHADRTTVAVLGAGGAWVAVCDGGGCSAASASEGTDDDPGSTSTVPGQQ